jgi:hypothetical protein
VGGYGRADLGGEGGGEGGGGHFGVWGLRGWFICEVHSSLEAFRDIDGRPFGSLGLMLRNVCQSQKEVNSESWCFKTTLLLETCPLGWVGLSVLNSLD